MLKNTCGSVFLLLAGIAPAAIAQDAPEIIWKRSFHSDRINSVVFSPDKTVLAAASSDGQISFWRVSDGSLVRVLNEDIDPVKENSMESISFSPDGTLLAAAGYRNIHIWRVADGALLRSWQAHSDWIVTAAFAPDGVTLASGSFDTTIKLWRTSDWALRQTFHHDGQVRPLAWSPDSTHLATGGGDAEVRIWHTPDGPMHHIWEGHDLDVESVAFSPDGLTVASGSQDYTVKIWNFTNNQLLRTLTGHTAFVYSVVFSADGQVLASTDGWGNSIRIWRVSDGALLRLYTEETTEVNTLAFGGNDVLAYGRSDGTVVLSRILAFSLAAVGALPSGEIQLRARGNPGQQFVLERSVDLANWTSISTNTFSSGPIDFLQTQTGPRMFYRARLL